MGEAEPGRSQIGRRREAALEHGSAEYHERKRAITAAAAAIFNDRGYRNTSMAAVARASGMDRGSLYYYIASKAELFDDVVREASEANVVRAQVIADGPECPPDKLRMLVEDLMAAYALHYPLLYIYIRENLSQITGSRERWAHEMRGLNRRYEAAVISIIQTGYDDGSLREVAPAPIVAYGVLGILGWTNRWYDPATSLITGPELGASYAQLLLDGLQTTSCGSTDPSQHNS